MIFVIGLLFLFIFLLNKTAFKIIRSTNIRSLWIGLFIIVICSPITIVGTALSIAYIAEIDGIGRGAPSLLAGVLILLNGIFIIFNPIQNKKPKPPEE